MGLRSEQIQWVNCQAIELCGFDEPGHEVKNIEFSDIVLGYPGKKEMQTFSLRLCENITIRNLKCKG